MVRGGRGRGDCCGVLSLMFNSFGLLLLNIVAVAFLSWTHWRSTGIIIMQLFHWQIIHFIGWEDGACGFLIWPPNFFLLLLPCHMGSHTPSSEDIFGYFGLFPPVFLLSRLCIQPHFVFQILLQLWPCSTRPNHTLHGTLCVLFCVLWK